MKQVLSVSHLSEWPVGSANCNSALGLELGSSTEAATRKNKVLIDLTVDSD